MTCDEVSSNQQCEDSHLGRIFAYVETPTRRTVSERMICCLFLCSLVLSTAAPVMASSDVNSSLPADELTLVAVVIENDTFSDTDQHYTNGLWAGFSPPPTQTPPWAQSFAERTGLYSDQARYRMIYTVGQNRQSWFFFAAAESRFIARNIFLNGSTFEDSPGVEREDFVTDLQVGDVFQRGHLKISHTHIFRTDEFEDQQHSTSFNAIGVARAF
ncbi:MAG: lipid A-modifier LpxR family protein [Pseudomonadota bacterium]